MSRRSKVVKVKECLRLDQMGGISYRMIGKSIGCSHNTVKKILDRAIEKNITWTQAQGMEERELEILLYGESAYSGQFDRQSGHIRPLNPE